MGCDKGTPVTDKKKGNRVGRRKKPRGTFVISGDIAVLATPSQFAPSVETCKIRYSYKREKPRTNILIIIKDKNGTEVSRNDLTMLDLMYGPVDHSGTWEWDGKDDKGNYVTPLQSPLIVELRHASGVAVSKRVNIEIGKIALWAEAYSQIDKMIMNNPDRRFSVFATVYLKKTDGGDVRTRVPIDVSFSFEDPGNFNTDKNHSFKYQSGPDKYLGKGGDNTAIYWEADPGWATHSDDGFKTKCKVAVNTNLGDNLAKAKVFFKPSAVGGNDFKLKATVYASDGATVLRGVIGRELTVWRAVSFTAYEMTGQTHVSTRGITAVMTNYFTNITFVRYTLGTVHNIDAQHSVKYIGLWDHANRSQKVWATWSRKLRHETPKAEEITKANGPAGADQNEARAAIQAKANSWRDRIIDQYNDALNNWASDAGVPQNTVVAIEFEHPKYSANAPNAESVTTEWGGLAWLRINVEGNNIHPDERWVWGQGLSHGHRAYITAGMGAARMEVVIAHEASHETNNQFKRALFGGGDHSAAAGLMDTTASLAAFTAGEMHILRGII